MKMSQLTPEQEKQFDLIFKSSKKSMGFIPNSIKNLVHKPFILGSLGSLHTSIMGFSSPTSPTPLTGARLFIKNFFWAIKARKQANEEVPRYLKNLVAYMSSNASGCRYCQAHTANEAFHQGVSIEKIADLWQFESSSQFSEKEKSALAFGLASGSVPNEVTEEHYQRLQNHFEEKQIIELVATVALFGFLNRMNDSMATVLEDEPAKFAEQYLSASGWEIGKHKG